MHTVFGIADSASLSIHPGHFNVSHSAVSGVALNFPQHT